MASYGTGTPGFSDWDLNPFTFLWREDTFPLVVGGDNTLIVGWNLPIPAYSSTSPMFTTVNFTVHVGTASFGDVTNKTLILYTYKNTNTAPIAINDERSTEPQVELSRYTTTGTEQTNDPISFDINPTLMNSLFRNSQYTSNSIIFTLESPDMAFNAAQSIRSDEGQSGLAATLTTTEHSQYTGWLDMPVTEPGAGVTDSRFGMPILSSHLVSDRFRPGISVRPSDVDQPDREKGTYLPSPLEGGFPDEPIDR